MIRSYGVMQVSGLNGAVLLQTDSMWDMENAAREMHDSKHRNQLLTCIVLFEYLFKPGGRVWPVVG